MLTYQIEGGMEQEDKARKVIGSSSRKKCLLLVNLSDALIKEVADVKDDTTASEVRR